MSGYKFFIFLLFSIFVLFPNSAERDFDSLNKTLFEKLGQQLDPYPSFLMTKSSSKEMQKVIDQYNLELLKKKISYLENIYLDSNIDLILSKYYEEIDKNILEHTLEIKKSEDGVQNEILKEKKLELEKYSLQEKKNKQEKDIKKYIFNKNQKYTYTPYDKKTGILRISDRKVQFPMILISPKHAQKILNKISFYTSQNDYPVFLIIENSYGGSFYAINLIIQAVENSRVPIYVVGKSHVAGGAAAILARAKYSFCYPTTLVTLTEVTTPSWEPVSDYSSFKQGVDFMKQYGERIYLPIIKKMNNSSIKTVDQLYARIRKENIGRYWMTTGVGAKKNKWVSNLIEDIRDDSIDSYDKNFSYNKIFSLQQLFDSLSSLENTYDTYFIFKPKNIKF